MRKGLLILLIIALSYAFENVQVDEIMSDLKLKDKEYLQKSEMEAFLNRLIFNNKNKNELEVDTRNFNDKLIDKMLVRLPDTIKPTDLSQFLKGDAIKDIIQDLITETYGHDTVKAFDEEIDKIEKDEL